MFALPPTPTSSVSRVGISRLLRHESFHRALPYLVLGTTTLGASLVFFHDRNRLSYLADQAIWLYSHLSSKLQALSDYAPGLYPTPDAGSELPPVWDILATRPEILNSFKFCSCGCGQPIDYHNGRFEVEHGKAFLESHFRCHECGKELQGSTHPPITTLEGHEEDGWVFHKDGMVLCVHDFIVRYCHHCACCGNDLGDKMAVDPQSEAAYCTECFQERKFQETTHTDDADRVTSQTQAERLLDEVKHWMMSELGITFRPEEADISLTLKSADDMNELFEGSLVDRKKGDKRGGILGITVKEGSKPSIFSQTKFTPKGVVLAKGLTREHAGAVLAHELMHYWIGLYFPRSYQLPLETEEGLCELMSYIWLVQESKLLPTEKQVEVEHLLGRMERNWSNSQGRGFHQALMSLQTIEQGNLKGLFSHVRSHDNFPTSTYC